MRNPIPSISTFIQVTPNYAASNRSPTHTHVKQDDLVEKELKMGVTEGTKWWWWWWWRRHHHHTEEQSNKTLPSPESFVIFFSSLWEVKKKR